MLTKQFNTVMTLCALALFATGACAQDHAVKKWYGVIQSGVVFNESDVNAQPSVAMGYRWKGFGIGLAAGIDLPDIRSMQYGIDLRKTFQLGNQQLLFFAMPALNDPLPTKEDRLFKRYFPDHRFKNGSYLETGAGILLGKKKNLLTAFYWSRKTHEETYSTNLWSPLSQEPENSIFRTRYITNRLGIKIGFSF